MKLGPSFKNGGRFRKARLKAILERQMGRRLAKLEETGGFARPGYASLGEYAGKRLHIDPRKAGEMARVAAALERLPALREASDSGRLTWAQVSLLLDVATPETEAAWVQRASGMSFRDLREEIRLRKEQGNSLDPSRSAPASNQSACKDPREETKPSEPMATIRCAMSPEGLALWKACVKRCRELYGQDMPEWECANRFIDAFFAAHGKKYPPR
jgi:hypothetical protein